MVYLHSLFPKEQSQEQINNIKLIGQPTNYFKFSAAVIGISFVVIAILIVIVFDQNIMVIIAVFISLGTALYLCSGNGCRNSEPGTPSCHLGHQLFYCLQRIGRW